LGPWKEVEKGIYIYYELHPLVNLREVSTKGRVEETEVVLRTAMAGPIQEKTIVVLKVKKKT
jgi:hypothetical protein